MVGAVVRVVHALQMVSIALKADAAVTSPQLLIRQSKAVDAMSKN